MESNSNPIKMMMMLLPVLLIMSSVLFFSASSQALVLDFCVADPSLPNGPSGYSCKNPNNVTADDFVYSGLATPGTFSNRTKVAIVSAFANQFGALNGAGISMVRADIAVGGAVPLHTHPKATEVIFIVSGRVTAGIISSTANKAYFKTLNKGDMMVFPAGLLHFQVNSGEKQALILASFSSPIPGVQIIDNALFGNDLPTELLAKATALDAAEIKQLKAVIGGSG